ncbi:hypothetical protein J3R83DRAFT_4637, partial [Lanmaoa asiatica]
RADADSGVDTREKHCAKTVRAASDKSTVTQPGALTESRGPNAIARVKRFRGMAQSISVTVLVQDASGPSKRERGYNP